MPREIDERKKRRVLARIRRAIEEAEARGETVELSAWEREFLESVGERVETFGAAFHDSEKGDLSEPLSYLQRAKLKELEKKAKGEAKPRKGLGPGKGFQRQRAALRATMSNDGPPEDETGEQDAGPTAPVSISERAAAKPPLERPPAKGPDKAVRLIQTSRLKSEGGPSEAPDGFRKPRSSKHAAARQSAGKGASRPGGAPKAQPKSKAPGWKPTVIDGGKS